MGYPRIIEKVWREPWAIKPSVHHSIQATLTAALNGERVAEPYDEEEEEAAEEEAEEPAPLVYAEQEFRARGHLVVMVQVYVKWDTYQLNQR